MKLLEILGSELEKKLLKKLLSKDGFEILNDGPWDSFAFSKHDCYFIASLNKDDDISWNLGVFQHPKDVDNNTPNVLGKLMQIAPSTKHHAVYPEDIPHIARNEVTNYEMHKLKEARRNAN